MDFVWLTRNIKNAWRHRGSVRDVFARLYLQYSEKLPVFMRCSELQIGFRYAEPVGRLQLLMRTNAGSDAFIHSEVFEHNYYQLGLRSVPATILDLGANTGMTAIYFRRSFPGVPLACVEPMPGNLRVLRRNLELNKVNAEVIAVAVDASDGFIQMEVSVKDYGHRVLGSGEISGREHIEVSAYSIPTLLSQLGWDRIGLLKIDIEGHEKVLLSRNASWLSRVDAIGIECHEGFDERDLQNLAHRFGFDAPQRLPGIWLLTRTVVARPEGVTAAFTSAT